jgi:hypothetical protein
MQALQPVKKSSLRHKSAIITGSSLKPLPSFLLLLLSAVSTMVFILDNDMPSSQAQKPSAA